MPPQFLIRCGACGWSRATTGSSKDLEGMREVMRSCSKCGKPRRFVCPKCRRVAQMTRRPSP